MMLLHPPAPALHPWVECLWYSDGPAGLHQRERALPTGTVEVVFNLRDDPFRLFRDDRDFTGRRHRQGVLCGAHSRYFVLDTSQPGCAVGIHFCPGGAAPFFGLPLSEVADQCLALEDVWGPGLDELHNRLREAASPKAVFAILDQALLARLQPLPMPHPAVGLALSEFHLAPAAVRIGEVQRMAGYGAKRFIELFSAGVGLTPKRYCRIRRFQSVIQRIARRHPVEWTQVALDGGYCDQSHLNREFRAFAGVTPAAYRPISDDRPSHIAID